MLLKHRSIIIHEINLILSLVDNKMDTCILEIKLYFKSSQREKNIQYLQKYKDQSSRIHMYFFTFSHQTDFFNIQKDSNVFIQFQQSIQYQELMEQEARLNFHEDVPSLLLSLIPRTYSTFSTTQQVKYATQEISRLLKNNPSTLHHLVQFLTPSSVLQVDNNFKKSCANLIKSHYYQISKEEIDKDQYIKYAFDLIMSSQQLELSIKDYLGVALQYIFNQDEKIFYKDKWLAHAKSQLCGLLQSSQAWTLKTLDIIYGIALFMTAYLNSLIEAQDQIQFLNSIQTLLCQTLALCCQFMKDNINQQVKVKKLVAAPQKLLQLFQISVERIFEQMDLIQEQANLFLEADTFRNILIEYLYLFTQQFSIVSKLPEINEMKATILAIIEYMVINDYPIQKGLVRIFLSTFVLGSLINFQQVQDDYLQKMHLKVMSVLQKLLNKKSHYDLFLQHKIQIYFALFQYSRTTNQQLSYLIEQPQKFVQLSEEFSDSFSTSPSIKIKASSFLRTIVKSLDEGLSNILQLCVIFITGSLRTSEQDSQILKQAKIVYADQAFINLSQRQKLDVSFMVLTVISEPITQRMDLKSIVLSLLISNVNSLYQIKDDLVIARLIRLIGFYPVSLYYRFMENLIPVSKVYLIQVLNSFDRISRNTAYLQTFPMMHMVYFDIIEYINLNDQIFDRLVSVNYNSILQKNEDLFKAVLSKIYESFIQSVTNLEINNCKQSSIVCLNYLEKILKAEKSEKKLKLILDVLSRIEEIGLKASLLTDNFISIYETITNKSIVVPEKVDRFAVQFSGQSYLSNYSPYSQIFGLINQLVLKSDKSQTLSNIYNNLIEYIGCVNQKNFNYGIIPQLAHTVGHIFVCNLSIPTNEKFLIFIANVICKKEDIKKSTVPLQEWFIFLLLHFIYKNPSQARYMLVKEKLYYPCMIALFTVKFTCCIQRKAAVIACQELVLFQQDENSQIEIIKYCVSQLKIQKQKYTSKIQKKGKYSNRLRRNPIKSQSQTGQEMQELPVQPHQDYELEQQRMQNEKGPQKDQDSVIFKNFKHPFDKICEFSLLKHRVVGLSNLRKSQIINIPEISQILRYQWHKNTVRKVSKIATN